ncbi:peptide chain release factor N(5)-glutamine methyltransferase [Pseudoalteromonas xiamenensis]|uniref:Release factor glutamine methyltransferase n=1 Tax=Pseudoalteromonas xiamenensis TaxID=882626 RepID=A0A975HKJ9_9GAMM|nr:peptide chain release factor N(5)-glutamine methyltransferase [Pseudoalteromonas xiamenensis]QTH71111.1 peptide chain release factor N(5)-glutamine methyltransferase [Pseudoalteromonas xiamenensis]
MSTQSIAQALAWATSEFSAISDSPKLDAQVLLLHVIEKPKSYLYGWSDAQLLEAQQSHLERLVARRKQGEPIAHITGTREFWSLPFYVNASTLIPRPDTETLVETVLAQALPEDTKLLDLGTGTGAIALSLANEHPSWRVTAIDYSSDAVELAKRNRQALALEHVNILQGSWYEPLKGEQFNVIVSNPPYIDPEDPHLEQGDVRFEPRSALVAEDEGYADLFHIISEGRKHLLPGGFMALEHGYNQAAVIHNFFAQLAYINILTIKDMAGCDRITVATWP